MTASDPYAAKRALFTLLAANALTLAAGTTDPATPIQVAYAYPRDIGMRCIYGGGVRVEHDDGGEEGVGVLTAETVSVGVYIRVMSSPGRSVEDNDIDAAAIGANMLAVIRASTTLLPAGTWFGAGRAASIQGGAGQSGMGTYEQTEESTISTLGYQFQFGRYITY